MESSLKPKQVLVLWRLIFAGEEPVVSRLEPTLNAREREELVAAGLVGTARRGRATHVFATEAGRKWAEDHLDAPVPPSLAAIPVLTALLAALQRKIAEGSLTLDEFLARGPIPEAAPAVRWVEGQDLTSLVREAYLAVSGGRVCVRVLLADLAQRLNEVPKTILDDHLRGMQRRGDLGLVLWSLDDPREIRPEDERAAVEVAGLKRHIVYLEDCR